MSMQAFHALLVFKPEVTEEQAAQALEPLRDLLELPKETTEFHPIPPRYKESKQITRPFEMRDMLGEHDYYVGPPIIRVP